MEIIGTDFENWGQYLMKQFHLMYEKGEKCDLEISCNQQVFLVHRLIMSACSEYVKELGDTQHIILPEEVPCKALKTVLDFVYSGKIIFKKEDKDDLLLTANLLNMRLLTELIKMEESCSFTLSMDDENDEKINEDLISSNLIDNSIMNDSSSNVSVQSSNQVSGKRKSSEMRSSRSRGNKNPVLPPLHKFPYLQQKIGASKTYGLITTLTDPILSRFEIPESFLPKIEYRSSFEDVSYETESLCKESETLNSLETAHIQFLSKLKETPNNKRSYASALYSPFDKYTPPYTSNYEGYNRRRDVLSNSYSFRTDSSTPKRYSCVQKRAKIAKLQPESNIKKNVPNLADTVIEVDSIPVINDNVEKSDITLEVIDSIYCIPEPLPVQPQPQPDIVEVPSLENGEKVELIKLNNVVVDNIQDDSRSRTVMEEVPDISISLIDSNPKSSDDSKSKTDQLSSIEKENFDKRSPLASSSESNAILNFMSDMSDSSEINESETDNLRQLPSSQNDTMIIEENAQMDTDSCTDSTVEKCTSMDCTVLNNPLNSEEQENCSEAEEKSINNDSVKPVVDISATEKSDVNITSITPFPLDSANVGDIPVDSKSQIFAIKVKGTEKFDQLSKLVDLCKKNPLFQNKNVRFKVVNVKGLSTLKEQTCADGVKRAIIVKKTEAKSENHKEGTVTPSKNLNKSAAVKDVHKLPIDNVTGPWECRSCNSDSSVPLVFETYFEYRNHLHDIHKEPNNLIYCIHCGHKSLKRNMQLYHLFVKHEVQPPPNLKFPKCDKCDFYALNDYCLQKHLICHPNTGLEYVCSCKLAFKTSETLQKHMVSGDCKNTKSFTCGYCRTIFDRFVNLKAHMRICMKERAKPSLQT